MKRKLFALLLCMVFICILSLPVYADSATTSLDGYSVLISDIPKVCPTCGSKLHAKWFSTSGAEVELSISDNGTIKIPAGSGVYAKITLYCTNCKYEKTEHRILGLDWGSEHPGVWNVEKAPSGIGRKDLPGYADDKGAALVDKDGQPTTTYTMLLDGYDTTVGVDTVYLHSESNNGSWYYQNLGSFSGKGGNLSVYSYYDVSGGSNQRLLVSLSYYYIAPVTGYYTLNPFGVDVRSCMRTNEGSYCGGTLGSFYGYYSFCKGLDTSKSKQFAYFRASEPTDNFQHFNVRQDTYFFTKGDLIFLDLYFPSQTFLSDTYTYHSLSIKSETPTLTVQDLTPNQITNNNNITINKNTWNGNIYVDNSTNLTYIYPQYTTINEHNETVTNISNNPIIYNNETKQYYTYDTVTNNYYYITYEQPATPTPSPSPSPSPTPTEAPSPSESPAPTPTPGGGTIITPGGDGSGSGSGSSSGITGGDDEGLFGWLWDLLKDLVKAILKAIFKVLSGLLGFLIWLVERVGILLPFLPAPAIAALGAGVVLVFVIRIIRFIRG